MKEQERLEVIKRIQNNIKEKESLKEKSKQLQELLNDPKVKQYFELLENIKSIEEKYEQRNSFEDFIIYEFDKIFGCARDIHMDVYPCKHDIWIYEGSYHSVWNFPWDNNHLTKTLSETSSWQYLNSLFEYNKYICLECHKRVETKEWQNFENLHFVLKNQNRENDLESSYYLKLYYELLFSNEISEAQKLIIEEFEKNKEKQNVKVLNSKKR